jgi:hypothetical protein
MSMHLEGSRRVSSAPALRWNVGNVSEKHITLRPTEEYHSTNRTKVTRKQSGVDGCWHHPASPSTGERCFYWTDVRQLVNKYMDC